MHKSAALVVIFVVLVVSLLSHHVAGAGGIDLNSSDFVMVAAPVWEQPQQVLIQFMFYEDETVKCSPMVSVLTNEEACVSVGSQVLIGNDRDIETTMIGQSITALVRQYGEKRFHMKFHIELNTLPEADPGKVAVGKGTYDSVFIMEMGKEYTLVDLSIEDEPGTKVTGTVLEASPTGWKNVTPVSIFGKDTATGSLVKDICKQAGLKLILEKDREKIERIFENEVTVFLTDVPCDKALYRLGRLCNFSVQYSKEDAACILSPDGKAISMAKPEGGECE